jgi:hypothetical protein
MTFFDFNANSISFFEKEGISLVEIVTIFSKFLIFLSRPISLASINKLESTPASGKIGIFFFPNTIYNELSIKFEE